MYDAWPGIYVRNSARTFFLLMRVSEKSVNFQSASSRFDGTCT